MEISVLLSCTSPNRVPLDYNHPHRLLPQVNACLRSSSQTKALELLKSLHGLVKNSVRCEGKAGSADFRVQMGNGTFKVEQHYTAIKIISMTTASW